MLEYLNQAHQTKDKMGKSLVRRPTGLLMRRNSRNTVLHILTQQFLPDNTLLENRMLFTRRQTF